MPRATEPTPDDLPELLLAAGQGVEKAWGEILRRYSRRVYAMARSRCRSDELAEEITQSVFVTVAMKLGSGAYTELGRFESWLFRVTMNRVRDEMRRRQRQASPMDPHDLPQAMAPSARQTTETADASFEQLRKALCELGKSDREIIELRHHAGMGFKQIAEYLEEPMGTVLARHHRALKKLKSLLQQDADESGHSSGSSWEQSS